MKTLILIILLIIPAALASPAQTPEPSPRPRYQAWIKTYDTPSVTAGTLHEILDSSVTLSHSVRYGFSSPVRTEISKFDARAIESISVRKHGSVGTGVLVGALGGIVAGGILDLVVISSYNNKAKNAHSTTDVVNVMFVQTPQVILAIAGSVALLGAGIGIGAAVGSAKISIPIDGDQDQFNNSKSRLAEYAVKVNPALLGKTFSNLPDSVRDADGNVYPVVVLGAQVWMGSDLKAAHYRDGSDIPGTTPGEKGAGNLYSWHAAADPRKACPAGWHLPYPSEWKSLIASLGGEYGALQSMEKGFGANMKVSRWWSSGEEDATHGLGFYVNRETSVVILAGSEKNTGLAVRCMRDN